MPYRRLLHIFDADDWVIRQTAPLRNLHESEAVQLGVRNGIYGLKNGLDYLIKKDWKFSAAVFLTHGNSGSISFNGEKIDKQKLKSKFFGMAYERLFPSMQARMYFSGCNAAEGDDGWEFLAAAASIFLKTTGGVAFGHTSVGGAMHPIVSFLIGIPVYTLVAGKSIHLWGDTRYVFVAPGGKIVKIESDRASVTVPGAGVSVTYDD